MEHQLHKNSFTGAIPMNLSKVFHTINYSLITVKPLVYGFGKNSLDKFCSFFKIAIFWFENDYMKLNTD